MKNKYVLLVFSLFLSLPFTSKAQTLSKEEGLFITRMLDTYLSKHDYAYHASRKSEFILALFEVDSNACIAKVSLLADEKNKDSTYAILSRVTPAIFKSKKFENCKGKIIIVPIYSIASDMNSSYVEKLYDYGKDGAGRDEKYVFGRSMYYQVPERNASNLK